MKPPIAELLGALSFSARKHRDQRRKGEGRSPYINHPIEVAEVLARVGSVDDLALLQAAILHDTVEDTETSIEEIRAHFGEPVCDLVAEVTDDKQLPKAERKRRQIEGAFRLSPAAKLLKIADSICNVRDVVHDPPTGWPRGRRREYLDWSEQVVAGCRGANAALDAEYDRRLAAARAELG